MARINNGDESYTEVPLDFEAEYYVADFDNDGNDDLLIFEKSDFHVKMEFGNSNGTFSSSEPTILNNSLDLSNIAVADYNNDGFLDFAQGEYTELNIFLNNGDGTFTVNTSDLENFTVSKKNALITSCNQGASICN